MAAITRAWADACMKTIPHAKR